jgi:hypothetical protein
MSHADRGFSAPGHARSADDAGHVNKSAPEERLLEVILQETERLLERSGKTEQNAPPADPDDMTAIWRVAQRHSGEPFSLHPIAKELTEAVLEKTYRPRVGSAAAWDALTTRIAQTLFDDPGARERLQAMWERLSETGR